VNAVLFGSVCQRYLGFLLCPSVSLKTWNTQVEAEFVCHAGVRLTGPELPRMMMPTSDVAAVS